MDAANRKDLILDAADRLLARYGYQKMTIDDVAQEAGIGKGTVYLHFSSKQEVVLSHVDRIVDRVLERCAAILEQENSAEEKLREILILRVLFRFDSVQHYTESLAEVLRQLRLPLLERRKGYFEAEARIVAKVLHEGQRTGAFRVVPALPTARAMVLATNSLLPFSLSTRELGERREVEASARRVINLLLRGLFEAS